MPRTVKLDQLEQAEAQALTRAAEARAAADEVRARAEQARAHAERQHDERVLAEWREDRPRLEAEVLAARDRLKQALLADPVWSAYADLILAGHRVSTRWLEAASTHARVHGNAGGSWGSAPVTTPPTWAELVGLVEAAATELGRAEAAAREQARVDAGQVAADKVAGR